MRNSRSPWTRSSRLRRRAGCYCSWVTSASATRSAGYVRECPFPDCDQDDQPHRAETTMSAEPDSQDVFLALTEIQVTAGNAAGVPESSTGW